MYSVVTATTACYIRHMTALVLAADQMQEVSTAA